MKAQLGGALPLSRGEASGAAGTGKTIVQLAHEEVDGQVLLLQDGRKIRIGGGRREGGAKWKKKPGDKNTLNYTTGERNTCHICKSEYHYASDCDNSGPRGKEKRGDWDRKKGDRNGDKKRGDRGEKREGAYTTEGKKKRRSYSDSECDSLGGRSFLEDTLVSEVILECGDEGREGLSLFTQEALGSAALDSGCTSSVTGRRWFNHYRRFVRENDSRQIKRVKYSNKTFKFGSGTPLNLKEPMSFQAGLETRK